MGDRAGASCAEEASGPPAFAEHLERKSAGKVNRALNLNVFIKFQPFNYFPYFNSKNVNFLTFGLQIYTRTVKKGYIH